MTRSRSHKKKITGSPGSPFLNKGISEKGLTEVHREYLGMQVPDDYFKQSKEIILKSIPMKNEQERRVFGLNRFIAYPIAASILILVAVAFWLQYRGTENVPVQQETKVAGVWERGMTEGDFLVNALLVDEAEMSRFADDYLFEQIVVKAELSEQQLEEFFINTMLVEDSLVNDYLDEGLVEHIVL